jgi:hypothetical protein
MAGGTRKDGRMRARARTVPLPVALLAALLAVGAVAGCGDDDPDAADPAPTSSSTATPSSPTTSPSSPTTSAGSSETPTAGGTSTVPVYFVGDTPQGPRLYREFRTVESPDRAMAALDLMTSGDALDPDYGTLYPDGSFADVEIDDDSIEVTLADRTWTTRAAGMTRAEARLAVQQLVYTLQGVAQARLPVEVELDGSDASLFGVRADDGYTNAPELAVRALVNVTTPEQGATVHEAFTATGVSSSFEATIGWELRDGQRVVKRGSATAPGWMGKLYPWRTKVRLTGVAPGEYTFVALTDDPTNEGPGPTEDSKSITVQ